MAAVAAYGLYIKGFPISDGQCHEFVIFSKKILLSVIIFINDFVIFTDEERKFVPGTRDITPGNHTRNLLSLGT